MTSCVLTIILYSTKVFWYYFPLFILFLFYFVFFCFFFFFYVYYDCNLIMKNLLIIKKKHLVKTVLRNGKEPSCSSSIVIDKLGCTLSSTWRKSVADSVLGNVTKESLTYIFDKTTESCSFVLVGFLYDTWKRWPMVAQWKPIAAPFVVFELK